MSTLSKNSVLIVAHPDDEVLWFSSLLDKIDRVIILFQDFHQEPGLGIRRASAIAELPYEVTGLRFPEAGTYGLVNWERPQISRCGLKLRTDRSNKGVSIAYQENFYAIRDLLREHLVAEMDVFTHNPWGEYGHADHVQAYRIVDDLRQELGFSLRVSTYMSSRSQPLAAHYVEADRAESMRCRIDAQQSQQVSEIYKRHRCWTWADDWVWDEEEYFLGNPRLSAASDRVVLLASAPMVRQIPSSVHGRLPRVG